MRVNLSWAACCVFVVLWLTVSKPWLWPVLAISSSCAHMQSFRLWMSGKSRLEGSDLPSKTFEMLQKWPARGAATRSLVNGSTLSSWSIVKRGKWTFRGRENTTWIVTCDWWLLSQPWSLSFFSFVVGSILANLCTSKLDLQSPQWRNANNTYFCKA